MYDTQLSFKIVLHLKKRIYDPQCCIILLRINEFGGLSNNKHNWLTRLLMDVHFQDELKKISKTGIWFKIVVILIFM